jgi:hypothetical protein
MGVSTGPSVEVLPIYSLDRQSAVNLHALRARRKLAKETQVRTIAEAVIRRVMDENSAAGRPVDSSLDAAYPFGARSGPVWEIWCDEVRRAFSLRSSAA